MDLHNALFWLSLLKLLCSVSSNIQVNNGKTLNVNDILDTTGSIIESCFTQYSRNVFISDAWAEEDNVILSRTFSLFLPIKLINLRDNKTFDVSNTNRFLSAYTDKNYVIVISSKNNLLIALQKLKNSKIWDHGGFYVVVYKNFHEGCRKKQDLLELMWTFNIIKIVLLCVNLNNQVYLYTFNPYTNVAPTFWTLIESGYRSKYDVWILKHKLKAPLTRATLHHNLDFDKTKDLAGYVIKVGVGFSNRARIIYDINKTGADRYLGKMGELSRMIWNHLNGTIDIRYYPTMCFQNENNQKCDIFKDLSDGKIDYLMNQLFPHAFWKYRTFPKETLGLCALAATDKKTATEKFLLTFTRKFWIIVSLTSLFSIIFLKYILNRSVIICSLEVLRILLCMPSNRQPHQSFKRFLFKMMIFLSMTLNSNFQSRLSAMFIVPDVDPYINSLQDLENSHMPVYGKKDFREYFFPSDVYYQYIGENQLEDCINRLKNGALVACVFPCSYKNSVKQSERVHLAKHSVKELFITTYVRSDWPLFLKVNEVIHKIYEAGFLNLFKERETELLSRTEDEKQHFFKLSISNLHIACLILAFGIIIATCVLTIEVITKIFLDY